jgi:hypothetical protein
MKTIHLAVLAAVLTGGLALTGCDRAVEEHKSVTKDQNGNVIQEDKSKITIDNNGNVKKEETHTDNR